MSNKLTDGILWIICTAFIILAHFMKLRYPAYGHVFKTTAMMRASL